MEAKTEAHSQVSMDPETEHPVVMPGGCRDGVCEGGETPGGELQGGEPQGGEPQGGGPQGGEPQGGEPQGGETPTGSYFTPTTVRRELAQLGKLAWVMVLTEVLHYTIGTVAIIFAGHQGELELDVVSLGTATMSTTAVAVATGLSGFCDTTFSQVFGSKDRTNLGVVLQRCLLMISLAICPCLALHINTNPILLSIGYSAEQARLTEQYMLILIPGTICIFIYKVLSKYVQNQNKELPMMFVCIAANVLNAVLHGIFIIWLRTGVWGSALSQCVSYMSMLVFTLIYIFASRIYKDTWTGWSSKCLLRWKPYFMLSIYSFAQHTIEMLTFDAAIILSGILGSHSLGAQSLINQYVLIFYTFGFGLGLSGGIRVGQHLGANDPQAARRSALVALTTGGMCGLLVGSAILALRFQMPLLFTSNSNIVELAAGCFTIIGIETTFDFLGATMNGILRGAGKQNIGSAITIPSFVFLLCVGLPVMLKTNLGIQGFWICCLITFFFQGVPGSIAICCLNWDKAASQVQTRIKFDVIKVSIVNVIETGITIGLGTTGASINKVRENHNSICETSYKDENKDHGISKAVICLRIIAFVSSVSFIPLGLCLRYLVEMPTFEFAHTNTTTAISDDLYSKATNISFII